MLENVAVLQIVNVTPIRNQLFFEFIYIRRILRSKGFRGAGVRRTPLPKAEALTEPAGETALTSAEQVAAFGYPNALLAEARSCGPQAAMLAKPSVDTKTMLAKVTP